MRRKAKSVVSKMTVLNTIIRQRATQIVLDSKAKVGNKYTYVFSVALAEIVQG